MPPKFRIPTIAIALTILALACGQLEIGIEPNNGDPIQEDAIYSPTEDINPQNCPLSDLNVYVNGTYSYCFGYPENFTLEDITATIPEVQGPTIGSEIEPVFATLRIEVDPISEDQSLREQAENFLRDFSVIDPDTYTWNQIEISGEPGLMVEPVPVHLSWKIIFVGFNENFYRLMYWPVDVQETELDLDELYQVTTQTFEFIE